jgi:hypothetical protein
MGSRSARMIGLALILGACSGGAAKEDGVMALKDGSIHWGDFVGDEPVGLGYRKLPDGRAIVGEWKGEDVVGDGIIYFNGGRYAGQIHGLQPNGTGRLVWGDCFLDGQWRNGEVDGSAIAFFPFEGTAKEYRASYWKGRIARGIGIQPGDAGFAGGLFEGGKLHGRGAEYDSECRRLRGGVWRQGRLTQREIGSDAQEPGAANFQYACDWGSEAGICENFFGDELPDKQACEAARGKVTHKMCDKKQGIGFCRHSRKDAAFTERVYSASRFRASRAGVDCAGLSGGRYFWPQDEPAGSN